MPFSTAHIHMLHAVHPNHRFYNGQQNFAHYAASLNEEITSQNRPEASAPKIMGTAVVVPSPLRFQHNVNGESSYAAIQYPALQPIMIQDSVAANPADAAYTLNNLFEAKSDLIRKNLSLLEQDDFPTIERYLEEPSSRQYHFTPAANKENVSLLPDEQLTTELFESEAKELKTSAKNFLNATSHVAWMHRDGQPKTFFTVDQLINRDNELGQSVKRLNNAAQIKSMMDETPLFDENDSFPDWEIM